jgi:hypothetical protein
VGRGGKGCERGGKGCERVGKGRDLRLVATLSAVESLRKRRGKTRVHQSTLEWLCSQLAGGRPASLASSTCSAFAVFWRPSAEVGDEERYTRRHARARAQHASAREGAFLATCARKDLMATPSTAHLASNHANLKWLRGTGSGRLKRKSKGDELLRPILEQSEIEKESEWRRMPIQTAVVMRPERARCPTCWGPVRAHKEGIGGKPRAHFEHRRAHRGCKWNRKFDGTARRHPDALE